jgi:hypothetical protein
MMSVLIVDFFTSQCNFKSSPFILRINFVSFITFSKKVGPLRVDVKANLVDVVRLTASFTNSSTI